MILSASNHLQKGETFFSVLISLGVLAILTSVTFTILIASFDLVNYSRSRITAKFLATEKMELIRNLSYADIGTIGGIPSGLIEETEQIVRNGLNYTIQTDVIYIDDSFDGTAPSDTEPEDYKRVRVEVTWEGLAASKKHPYVLITDVSPRQTDNTSGGMLVVSVVDANGLPVPDAEVLITADSLSPPVDVTLQTNADGVILLPGAQSCENCYSISVTKDNFSTDKTFSTDEITNPNKPHQSIIENEVTEITFSIDGLTTLSLQTVSDRNTFFTSLPNTQLRIYGTKTIGTNEFLESIYKYDEIITTDITGNYTTELEWDTYTITPTDDNIYTVAGTNPPLPLVLLPESTASMSVALSPYSEYTILSLFTDISNNPLSSVSATVSDEIGGSTFSISGAEDDPDFGYAFFPDLEMKVYTLFATLSGYLDYSRLLEASGSTQEHIILVEE